MKKEIIVNRSAEETRVAVLEDGILIDLFIERRESEKIVGNIYKGKVKAVLPGLSSAFISIGFGKDAYLSSNDVISEVRTRDIGKMLSRDKEIMVQVSKEPINNKGSRITMDISLPGRLLVFMPFSDNIGISKNIESREERERLKKIICELKPEKCGVIVRTEAEEATKEELKREMKYLTRLWESIEKRNNQLASPALLHKDLGVVFQTVRDYFNEEVEIMLIDLESEYNEVLDFVKIVSPELIGRVKLYTGKTPIFKAFNIEEEIKRLRSNRVKLPSGGSIIIQEAESLCAIDVNTGSFTGKKSQPQEEIVTLNNIEAAKEIARQVRLRNIGGILVIDFIDMIKAKNRHRVLEALRSAVRKDKAKIKIWPITRLGLIEMTRERKRESLFSLLGETCPSCHGCGLVVSKESLFIHIVNELTQMKLVHHYGKVRLVLNPAVSEYFKTRVSRLEKLVGGKIEIQPGADVDREDYKIFVE